MFKDCIVLLDVNSQKTLRQVLTELLANKIKVINYLNELNTINNIQGKSVLFFEGFFQDNYNFASLLLYKELYDLQLFFVGSLDTLLQACSSFAKCYKLPLEDFTYQKFQAICNNDLGSIEQFTIDPENLIASISQYKNKNITDITEDDFHKIINSYLVTLDSLLLQNDKVNSLQKLLSVTETKRLTLKEQLNKVYTDYNNILDAEINRNKMLLQYEVLLTKDVYQKILASNYRSRPFIIYFKQYTKINNFDYFIYTLYECFRIQKSLVCKCVKLYDSSASMEMALQPSNVKIIQNKYTLSDIETNDFLAKYGNYLDMMHYILTNKMGVQVLCIFDCKNHNDLVMSDADMTFSLCQNIQDAERLGLNKSNTITNDSESKLRWSPDQGQLNKLNEADTFMYLSAQPAIRSVLSTFNAVIKM